MSKEGTCAGCLELRTELAVLRREYETLKRQHQLLLTEVVRLRELVQQDSSNSHRPPSSDGPEKKTRSLAPRKRKRRGAKKGHKGSQRQLLPPDEVDETHDLVPSTCATCAAPLAGQDPDPVRHQVTELIDKPTHITEWRLHRLHCSGCGHTTRADLPHDVSWSPLGPRLQAFCVLMTGALLLTKSKACDLLTMLGVSLTPGGLCAVEQRARAALQPAVAEIQSRVQTSDHIHLDETGWKLDGKRHWLWVATCAIATLFVVDASRGGKVARAMVGESFEGVAHTDRFSGYNWLPVDQRQVCWAHLMRDFRKIGQRDDEASQHLATVLREVGRWVFFAHRRTREGTWSRRHLKEEVERVRAHTRSWLQWGVLNACDKTVRTCQKILRVEPSLWTFVWHERVEPTNNAAERALRHAVVYRKRSFGNVSARGASFIACIFSVFATLRQNGRDALSFLTRTIQAHLSGLTPPKLFPILA